MGDHRNQPLILVVDDDPAIHAIVGRWLDAEGYRFRSFDDGESCLGALAESLPSAILLDLDLPGIGGLEVLERIKRAQPHLPILILTGDEQVETVVSAMQAGAYDYLVKPLQRARLAATLGNAIETHGMATRITSLEREATGGDYPGIVGRSTAMRSLYRQLDRAAPSMITVLIRGESGTGKELVARALHDNSSRRVGPFVALNCAAVPGELLESEMFGHERGAFTGAARQHRGLFEQADGGTLLLDEVAELTLPLQAKLLRVLQERSFRRVGGKATVRSDFRLLAATHRDLREEVRRGRFREDLYYRIDVFELTVSPLRERREDIPLLTEHFVTEFSSPDEPAPPRVTRGVLDRLLAYPWPGNVRELRNALQRAVLLCAGGVIRPDDLPPTIRGEGAIGQSPEVAGEEETLGADAPPTLEQIERCAIEEALARHDGNLSETVRELGIGRTTLYRKLRKYGLR